MIGASLKSLAPWEAVNQAYDFSDREMPVWIGSISGTRTDTGTLLRTQTDTSTERESGKRNDTPSIETSTKKPAPDPVQNDPITVPSSVPITVDNDVPNALKSVPTSVENRSNAGNAHVETELNSVQNTEEVYLLRQHIVEFEKIAEGRVVENAIIN